MYPVPLLTSKLHFKKVTLYPTLRKLSENFFYNRLQILNEFLDSSCIVGAPAPGAAVPLIQMGINGINKSAQYQ
jgi:hypothetical protein